MLSDSIFTAITAILNEIKYYSRPPFEYGLEHKPKFIEALANLYFVLHSLDGLKTVDMDTARESANKAWDEAFQSSPL